MSKTVCIQPKPLPFSPPNNLSQFEFKTVEKAHGIGRFVYVSLHGANAGELTLARYEEGCEYQGEFRNGLRHGFGYLSQP